MGQAAEIGRRGGAAIAEWQAIVEGVDFVPERVSRTEVPAARELLDRDGAVIVTGWPVEPDSVVNAAAAVRLHHGAPELYEFLTTVDIDVSSRNTYPDVYRVPRVCRMVEWTRGGRMIVRVAECAQPAPRETQWEAHERLIAAYAEVITILAVQARGDTALAAGEVLVLDNYRCLHGARAHQGRRTVHVLRCKSQDGL